MLLTTDHPASSYGQPVLVGADNAYGPADIADETFGLFGTSAADLVREEMDTWMHSANLVLHLTHGAGRIDPPPHAPALADKFVRMGGHSRQYAEFAAALNDA